MGAKRDFVFLVQPGHTYELISLADADPFPYPVRVKRFEPVIIDVTDSLNQSPITLTEF